MVTIKEEDYLAHYGILRRSGRYPWGTSGWGAVDRSTFPRNATFLETVDWLKGQGLSESQIAQGFGISTTQLRAVKSMAKAERKAALIRQAQELHDKGMGNTAAARQMGIPEPTYRELLKPGASAKSDILASTASMLKDEVDSKSFIDIGAGVENHLGISKERLKTAVAMLQEQGYEVHNVKIKTALGNETEVKVLTLPGKTQKDVFLNQDKIRQISRVSEDGGHTFYRTDHPPIAVDPKRVAINYAEDGGKLADGVIYVRPGVEDLSLGGKRYGQVRIQVGDGHYLKGMAVYKDDLPDGVDLVFNTDKSDTGNKFDAMKPLKEDSVLPFGSIVRQIVKNPGTPEEQVTSALNIVGTKEDSGVEGSWGKWSRNISAQALSKQSPKLAKQQLDMTYEARKEEYDRIMELTNPVIKRKLLETFADSTDSSAVHMKAAALERQNWHVILPVNSLKPNEIYAPGYHDGENVALIRYPHGGTFEIPELRVNNKNREARKLLGTDTRDAVGIHHSVAERLSGADFDGDTVLVIPNNNRQIVSTPALRGLKDFNPKDAYPAYEGMPKLSPKHKQKLMGDVSNLITDMTLKGATADEVARAVRHSMVVIDAEKHHLNYKLSAQENGIKALKEKYQGGPRAGAATLISRAGGEVRVKRKPRPAAEGGPIDPKTGKRVYINDPNTKTEKVKRLSLYDDAHELSSGTTMEKIYANHSNRLKNLANQARVDMLKTPPLKYSPSARKTYAKEVASLDSKLAIAHKNKPLERQAQIIANVSVRKLKQADPSLEGDKLKKIKYGELEKARARMGAHRNQITIEPKEWDAIQAGAISNHKLEEILKNADLEVVRKLATPRPKQMMTSAKTARAMSMLSSGYTRAEVAAALGVSVSTLDLATVGDDWED